ncbi:MAG: hypothetical protein AABY15_01140 [Nanoarchaeota archaeon]
MDLQFFVEAAEEFAEIVWPIRDKIKVGDLMMIGSVARKVPNPIDLDMMILHENPGLDEFQRLLRSKIFFTDQEAFHSLQRYLKEANIIELLEKTRTNHLVARGLFHTSYINTAYFRDGDYKWRWDTQNSPEFARIAFSEGMLWNPETKHYDIPAKTRYVL